jgi:hypothetical protein
MSRDETIQVPETQIVAILREPMRDGGHRGLPQVRISGNPLTMKKEVQRMGFQSLSG